MRITGLNLPAYPTYLLQTTSGRLLMFMRTEMQRIAQSYSIDGGVHWEQGALNELVSSRSEIWLDRMPGSGDLLCVWNPGERRGDAHGVLPLPPQRRHL